MTNDERSPNPEVRNGETGPVGVPFELRISVFLRHSHSDFVIIQSQLKPAARRLTEMLSMNRPTPDPSQEGSRCASAPCQFPSWEGLGVGSRSQCMRKKRKGALHEPQHAHIPPDRH